MTVRAIKALEELPYDLVFMDCQMPNLDGYEATKNIRSAASKVLNPNIPIVAMTAHAMAGDRQRCLDAGMNDYLTKPLRPSKIQEALENWLSHTMVEEITPEESTYEDKEGQAGENSDVIFDAGGFASMLMDDKDLMREVAETFVNDMPIQLARLKQALADSDLAEVSECAHGIKGAAGNVCGPAVAEVAGEIEHSETLEGLDKVVIELERKYEILSERMTEILG